MNSLAKILSCILTLVMLIQVILPGAVQAIAAFDDGIIKKSASKGTSVGSLTVNGQSITDDELLSNESNHLSEDSSIECSDSIIIGEVEELRDENIKHFRHSDGTYTVAVYNEPVHYKDDSGNWQDIDNTLTLDNVKRSRSGKATYTPASSGLDIRIPQDFSDSQKLTIGKDEYILGIGALISYANAELNSSNSQISNKLSAVTAKVNNDFELESNINTSVLGSTETVEDINSQKMHLENKASEVKYENIVPNTDFEYIIKTGEIQENIVIKRTQTNYIYSFELELGSLISREESDGSISLLKEVEDEEAFAVISVPCMYDANYEVSSNLNIELNNNVLTIEADEDWINAQDRSLPVTIMSSIEMTSSEIEDTYVSSNLPNINHESALLNYVGTTSLATNRTYMKFNLPTLPSNSMITDATLSAIQSASNSDLTPGEDRFIYVFDLTGKPTWQIDSITWNNQPVSNAINEPQEDSSMIIDYNNFSLGSNVSYEFNLTKTIKYWYEKPSDNNGIMIASNNESLEFFTSFCSYDSGIEDESPVLTISYNINVGLEDYWSYKTFDFEKSGTAYVNNYNGSLTYLHNDLSMTGNLLPIKIDHVYNNNDESIYATVYSNMNLGKRFHLNLQEMLRSIPSSDSLYSLGYRYKYYDSDGTLHYFCQKTIDGVTKITHEFDSTLEISISNGNRVITDIHGNKKYFSVLGRLLKTEDANGNIQTITYDDSKIIKITDPVGRNVLFNYNDNNQLISITDPAGRQILFEYNGSTSTSQLKKITYPDGKSTQLTYSGDEFLRVTEKEGNFWLFTNTTTKCGKRVKRITKYIKNSSNSMVAVDYTNFSFIQDSELEQLIVNTVVKNKNGDTLTYLFDEFGRAISITNQYDQTQYITYGSDVENSPNSFNDIIDFSDKQSISTNLLKNHGFENNNYWTALQTCTGCTYGYSDEVSKYGTRSLKLELTDSSGVVEVDQDFTATAGETYTVSADVYIPEELELTNDSGVTFGFVYCIDGDWFCVGSDRIGLTVGWERFTYTTKIPAGSLENCHVFIKLSKTTGAVYFDNIQVENSGGASEYNLVENSDFSQDYGWACTGDPLGYYTDNIDGRSYKVIKGDVSAYKSVDQSVSVNLDAGETLTIGGKVAANATTDKSNNNKFEISLIFLNDNSTIDQVQIKFDRSIKMGFQTLATSYTLPEHCDKILYRFTYAYHINPAYLSDAFIYVGDYGEHYEYNDNGLVSKTCDNEGKVTNYEYDENDVISIEQTISGVTDTVVEYEYDDNHNVISATNNIGTEIEYEYNENGQITEQRMTSASDNATLCEQMTYIQNGNYLKTFTDINGDFITYTYDNNDQPLKGLVVRALDSKGFAIDYTYDDNTDELISAVGNADFPSLSIETTFANQNNSMQTITPNSTTYSYVYDSQKLVTEAKVGTQTLVSNTYDDTTQRLLTQTYSNGDVYEPVYDSHDRIGGEKWNNNQTVEYYYDANDRLTKLTDNLTGVSYQYDYALYNLLNKIEGSDGTLAKYLYDSSGQLSEVAFSKDGDIINKTKYFNDEKGNQSDVIIETLDNTLLHYNYDGFGRVTGISYGPIVNEMEYHDNLTNTGCSTDRVNHSYVYDREGYLYALYEYSYDSLGRLEFAIDYNESDEFAAYVYDDFSRLSTEYLIEDTYEYAYDVGGNLTSVKLNDDVIHTYTYGNSNWKDQLTAFDNKTITYDLNGNPLSYDGYTYSWVRNSLLESITGNGKNISYAYDSQGHRVQKTVNGVTTTYTYLGDVLMRQSDGTSTIDFAYDANGKAVGFSCNGNSYFYIYNPSNDVTKIVDSSGNVVASYYYDAYGNIVESSGIMAAINPIRYRGYYYDNETGYYYLKTRYYNPEWRRFINADSLFVAGNMITGCNMYAYCNGNPVRYVDSEGTAPEENDKIYNYIRVGSKLASWLIMPETIVFFAVVNTTLLPAMIDLNENGGDFSNSDFMKGFTKFLSWAANSILPIMGGDYTYDKPTGLRHFWFANMALGAPWAGYLLGFEKSTHFNGVWSHTNYTTVEDKYMWQSEVGYSWVYDAFFSLGGPIERLMCDFESGTGDNKKYYILWCWKADYWNLGAGAEIGIYSTTSQSSAENNYYQIDENLTVHTRMRITYNTLGGHVPIELNDFHQTNWWVTSFTPFIQHPDVSNIDVVLDVRFTNENYRTLMKDFYTKWFRNQDEDDWPKVSMLPYVTTAQTPCSAAHLALCECETPCGYYSTVCSPGDERCTHYNDADNGFQFRISY